GDHTQYYLHARLTRLRPGRTYYYGVGHEGFDPAERHLLGTLGTFTTAPAHKAPFTFTAFGDHGVSYHALANDRLIICQNPALACASRRPSICTTETARTGTRPAGASPPTRASTRAPGTSFCTRPSRSPSRSRGWSRTATTTWRPGTRPTATAAKRPAGPCR